MIIQTAVKLFAENPFHKVRLDDLAEAAGIGKGTVYIYFKSKDDLYYNLIYDGFADIVQDIGEQLAAEPGDARRRVEHPELTAVYFTAMVRAVMMYGPKNIDGDLPAEHVTSIFVKGIAKAVP